MLAKYIEEANKEYRKIRDAIPLGVLRSKREYQKAVQTLDDILDEIGEDETHPLAELADSLSVFIENYENIHLNVPQASPAEVLKFLMDEHGLKQTDLVEIGSQGVVSEILAGKREINTRQIKKLSERFGVSPAVFL
jgi:HTH-type transcriptional regulator/antitoxin HigA